MRVGVVWLAAFLFASGLYAGSDTLVNPADLLTRVREANEQLYSDLESFVCNEQMVRYKGPLNTGQGRQVDTITARLSFENGEEHYTDIRQNKRPRVTIPSLSGAWSEGEFGTLLRQTQLLLGVQPVTFERNEDMDGTAAAVYSFEVSEADSPWDLEVGSAHYRLPFRTEVWVSGDSGRILKIERWTTSVSPETRISQVRWGVVLSPVELNGRTWLLPRTGEYSVSYPASGRREWNVLRFSDYHRYGSEVALRFDQVK